MRTATAIYHAPEGDAKSCTMNGVIFNDGEAVELNSSDHGHLMNKLANNGHFEFKEAAAEDEAEPKDGLKGVSIAELRQMAEEKGIEHEGKSKADLREALSQ